MCIRDRCSYSHKDKCRHVSVWTIGPTVLKAMVLSRSDQPRIDEENIAFVNRKNVSKHEQAWTLFSISVCANDYEWPLRPTRRSAIFWICWSFERTSKRMTWRYNGGPYLGNSKVVLWRKSGDCSPECEIDWKKDSSKWVTAWKIRRSRMFFTQIFCCMKMLSKLRRGVNTQLSGREYATFFVTDVNTERVIY